jgi:hypothetical protein
MFDLIHDAEGNPLQPFSAHFSAPVQTFSAGAKPVGVTAGDFNGDGKPDLAVANSYGSNLSILLGNGNGTFAAQQTVVVGAYPNSVAVGDVNGDGIADVVSTNNQANCLSVLLGNGDGTFQAQKTLVTGLNPNEARIGDLNNDGKPDLFVSNLNSGTESIYLGNGDGTFQVERTLAVGPSPISSVGADLNGDGKLDLVISQEGVNLVEVLLGNGGGTFAPTVTYAGSGSLGSLIATDVNGDGVTDVEVAEGMGATVGVFLGNGDGTLISQQTTLGAAGLQSLNWSDLNGDGAVDLITGGTTSGKSVGGSLGLGNGGFSTVQTFNGGNSAWGLAVLDYNGDGRADIASANRDNNTVTLLSLNPFGTFDGEAYTIVPPVDTASGTGGADTFNLKLDKDGVDVDWSGAGAQSVIPVGDPNGLTINGNGGNDVIALDFTNGNPLPNTHHLNGSFTINGLSGTNPFSGTTLEIGQSTVYVNYADGPSPAAAIFAALQGGCNGGAWNGSGAGVSGAITSVTAASGPAGAFGIGFADSADGMVAGQPANTVEIRYTLMGDANLDGTVNGSDAVLLGRNYLVGGKTAWDLGNFNYDSTINLADAAFLQKNYNATVTASLTPAAVLAGASGAGGAGNSVALESVSTQWGSGAGVGTSGDSANGSGLLVDNGGNQGGNDRDRGNKKTNARKHRH